MLAGVTESETAGSIARKPVMTSDDDTALSVRVRCQPRSDLACRRRRRGLLHLFLLFFSELFSSLLFHLFIPLKSMISLTKFCYSKILLQ